MTENGKTYNVKDLFESVEALVKEHPMMDVPSSIEVVAELAEGNYPVPGDILDIVSIKFNPQTGYVHLKVAEKD
jgi:hypothetical protein